MPRGLRPEVPRSLQSTSSGYIQTSQGWYSSVGSFSALIFWNITHEVSRTVDAKDQNTGPGRPHRPPFMGPWSLIAVVCEQASGCRLLLMYASTHPKSNIKQPRIHRTVPIGIQHVTAFIALWRDSGKYRKSTEHHRVHLPRTTAPRFGRFSVSPIDPMTTEGSTLSISGCAACPALPRRADKQG